MKFFIHILVSTVLIISLVACGDSVDREEEFVDKKDNTKIQKESNQSKTIQKESNQSKTIQKPDYKDKPDQNSSKVDLPKKEKNYIKDIEKKIIGSFCSQSILNKVKSSKSKYDAFKSKVYSKDDIHFSNDLYDISSMIMPLACNSYVNDKDIDKSVDLLLYWVTHYGRDNGTKKYFIEDNKTKTNVNLSTYEYSSKKIRKAASLLLPKLKGKEKEIIESYLVDDLSFDKIVDSTTSKRDFIYNTDYLYNSSEGLLIYFVLSRSEDIESFTTYLERFLEPTSGWLDGLKADGVSFHHGFHYNAYMYAFKPIISTLYLLDNTPYQITKDKYKFLRDSIFNISLMNMNEDELPSLGGRHPFYISFPINKYSIEILTKVGGHILKEDIDKKMASLCYRIWKDPRYKEYYDESYSKGFWQFNYGALGIYRDEDWLVGLHGFNYSFKGGEISPTSSGKNIYGRYQAYGTIEILYEGGKKNSAYPITGALNSKNASETGGDSQGFGWDWNRWPGTTSIVLPWDKLLPVISSATELNEKKFAGALRFQDKKSGIFAMDFKQYAWKRPNHTDSFVFKKSVFAFDDMLVAMGTNINNNNKEYSTITTLFQNRILSDQASVEVDDFGTITKGESINHFNSSKHRWIIDSAGTGYYMIDENMTFTIRASTQTSPNRLDLNASMKNATSGEYITAWIDHGKAPKNGSYYYVIIPNSTPEMMNSFQRNFSIPHLNGKLHQLYIKNRMAYVLFEAQKDMDMGILKESDTPIMAMYQKDADILKLTVVNPDLGYKYWGDIDNIKAKEINLTLKGNWSLSNPIEGIEISHKDSLSILKFTTKDGLPVDINLIEED